MSFQRLGREHLHLIYYFNDSHVILFILKLFLGTKIMVNKIFNYDLTIQVYNSNNAFAKIAKYSLVGIALIAIVETIKNIVLSPIKLIANFCKKSEEKPSDKKNFAKSWLFFIGKHSGLSNLKNGVKNLAAHRWENAAFNLVEGIAKGFELYMICNLIIAIANKIFGKINLYWYEPGVCQGLSRRNAIWSCATYLSNTFKLDPLKDFLIGADDNCNCQCIALLTKCPINEFAIGYEPMYFTTPEKITGMLVKSLIW